MRCKSCDKVLNNYETRRKSKTTGEYLDLCSHCLSSVLEVVTIPMTGRLDSLEEAKDDSGNE